MKWTAKQKNVDTEAKREDIAPKSKSYEEMETTKPNEMNERKGKNMNFRRNVKNLWL